MMDTMMFIVLGTLGATTPLLFAALGEMVAERSGVLNLSIEGMMAHGAAVAFAVATLSHSHSARVFARGALAAAALSFAFGLLVLVCLANQVAAGLAIGLLGLGVSALVGKPFEGNTIAALGKLISSAWPMCRSSGRSCSDKTSWFMPGLHSSRSWPGYSGERNWASSFAPSARHR